MNDGETAEILPEFHPRNMGRTGIAVLEHGLPLLPEVLTRDLAIPITYWTASQNAIVLFLRFHCHDNEWEPVAIMARFNLDDGHWTANRHWPFTGFSHDPIADPGSPRDPGGRAIVVTGRTDRNDAGQKGHISAVRHGVAAPAVKQIALIQAGHEDRRPLRSHFGAWVVCTEQPSPFSVRALDHSGTMLDEITP